MKKQIIQILISQSEGNTVDSQTETNNEKRTEPTIEKKRFCHFYVNRGSCKFGEECKFLHEKYQNANLERIVGGKGACSLIQISNQLLHKNRDLF